jgi:prepilin-type processing-associated H-X9-DG protein
MPGQPCNNIQRLDLNAPPAADNGDPGTYTYVTYEQVVATVDPKSVTPPTDKLVELSRVQYDRHREGANYIFCDGHAKYQKLQQTLLKDHFEWGEYFYPQPAPHYQADGELWNKACY